MTQIMVHKAASGMLLPDVHTPGEALSGVDEMLDLMGDISYQGYNAVIIHKASLGKDFFDLRTGIAGEILQKFSNYRLRLAVVGDFSMYTSRSWRDFLRESNRNRAVNFVNSLEEAILILSEH